MAYRNPAHSAAGNCRSPGEPVYFLQLDKNSADIKEVRENYTTRTSHQKDLEAMRRDMKEMRTEMRTEMRQMSEDVKDIKENGVRREEYLRSQLKLENKLDRLMELMMKGAS